MSTSIRAAPEGLRSPRSHLRTVPSEAPAARANSCGVKGGLEPRRRHERPIDHDRGLPRPRIGLPLRISEGALEPGNVAVKIGFSP